jgi:hypothetical protein
MKTSLELAFRDELLRLGDLVIEGDAANGVHELLFRVRAVLYQSAKSPNQNS